MYRAPAGIPSKLGVAEVNPLKISHGANPGKIPAVNNAAKGSALAS